MSVADSVDLRLKECDGAVLGDGGNLEVGRMLGAEVPGLEEEGLLRVDRKLGVEI